MSAALVYVRQSRNKDYERTTSPEVQENACRELAAVQACDQIEVYVDLDKSGKNVAKRPNFQKFLKHLQAVAPTVVAVYDHPAAFTTLRKRWSSLH